MTEDIDRIGVMDDAWDILAKCVMQKARDHPSLLRFRPQVADVSALTRDDGLLVVESVQDARMCVLVAEGLLAMSELIHAPGDRADIPSEVPELTPARAIALKKEHGSYRATAAATGINRQALWRAVKIAEEEGIGIA